MDSDSENRMDELDAHDNKLKTIHGNFEAASSSDEEPPQPV